MSVTTSLSTCLKNFFMISGTGTTTPTTAARNLFAESVFATRSSAGSYIGYNTVTNTIVFSHTGSRFIEVIFTGTVGASGIASQVITLTLLINGSIVNTIQTYSGQLTFGYSRQVSLYGIYSVTSASTVQINYSGGTNCSVREGSSVIVRFIQ